MSEASSGSQAVLDPLTDVEPGTARAPIWITVVFNDPVNLMNYVTYVFQEYFGYSRTKAEELMLQVHEAGRSIVSRGSREEMERDTQAMHEYGLWASARPAGEEDA